MEKKATVITNGCPENRIDCAETELFLLQNGWKITPEVDQADCVILNLCGLLDSSEKTSLDLVQLIGHKKKTNAKLIVTGCLPKINNNSIKNIFKGDIIKGHNIKKMSELLGVENISNGISANYLISPDLSSRFSLKTTIDWIRKKMQNEFVFYSILNRFHFVEHKKYFDQINIVQPNTFYIKVSSGCEHGCSYCAIKRSRGSVKSKPVDAIKNEFMEGLKAGYTQFALIGTDLGSYGKDVQTDLLVLLREIVSIDGKFEIKLRNVHPKLLINQLSELLTIVKTGKITHITTAIQHGNDRILSLMKRTYTIKDCKFAINVLKDKCPNLKIRTQLMVGFPSETDSEFNDTLRLIDEVKVDFIEVYPFSPRIGTLAAKMQHQIARKTVYHRRIKMIKKNNKIYKRADALTEKFEYFERLPATVNPSFSLKK